MTTLEMKSLGAGQQVLLALESWRSPLRIINHGPGGLVVRVVDPALGVDDTSALGVEALEVPVRGPITVSIGNPADDGPDPVGLRIEILDPATFSFDIQPMPAAAAPTR